MANVFVQSICTSLSVTQTYCFFDRGNDAKFAVACGIYTVEYGTFNQRRSQDFSHGGPWSMSCDRQPGRGV